MTRILVTGRLAAVGKPLVIYKEAEPFTTRVKHMDFSRARRDLNHDPRIPLEEGIARTIDWVKNIFGLK